ncbi:MAG TPA: response regulator [Xanthobacteraceae bacterium]|nr:response regulator [Xanthobacteraceae bacterium]
MSTKTTSAVTCVVKSGTASVGSAARLAGQRILIVEDNHFVAHQFERVLTDAGCEITDIVTTADDAVRATLERRPQLVLMDIYLPGKRDGVEAAMEIFERCGIRSIFASAPVDLAVKTRAEAARPLAWLPKPFSDKKLLATVEQAIANTARPSLTLKSRAQDERNTINPGPEHPTLRGSEKQGPDVLAKAASLRNLPPVLAAQTLAELWRGLVTGEGPYVRGRVHFSRTLDTEDAILCEHLLIAAEGEVGTPVSQEEADILIEIYETGLERRDGGRFDDLFVKAIAHHVVATRGGPVPSRSVALARETPLRSWVSLADLETVAERIAAWATGRRSARRTMPLVFQTTRDMGGRAGSPVASVAHIVDLAA